MSGVFAGVLCLFITDSFKTALLSLQAASLLLGVCFKGESR
jgi:hypothetical protein